MTKRMEELILEREQLLIEHNQFAKLLEFTTDEGTEMVLGVMEINMKLINIVNEMIEDRQRLENLLRG